MKTKSCSLFLCRLFLCALLGCCLASTAGAQEKKAEPSQDEMMAMMEKLAAPGEHHKKLEAFVGSWKTRTKAWMGPGDPQVSDGTAETSWILGGRFVREEFRGTFMGKPFEGTGTFGYDNLHKEYVSTWADNLGTGLMLSKGKVDATGKVFTYMTDWEDPSTGQKKPVKMVTKIVSDREHVFSMIEPVEGKDTTTMEITYTRR